MSEIAKTFDFQKHGTKMTLRHANEVCRRCIAEKARSGVATQIGGSQSPKYIDVWFPCAKGSMGMTGFGPENEIDLTNMTDRKHPNCAYGLEVVMEKSC